MTERATVAVIGAGFSGVLTALRLLLAADGPRVLLIERAAKFGRGAAYATNNPRHLLNVRAANMSAFVEEPSHFLDWLTSEGTGPAERGAADVDRYGHDLAPEKAFVTRDRYGQYLQSLLRKAAAGGGRAAGRLSLEHDEVRALTRNGAQWELHLALGRVVTADAVVLALGNLPPPTPVEVDQRLVDDGLFVADPWAWDPARTPPDGEVLLLGSGLTAVDVTLSIEGERPGTRVTALSRLAACCHVATPPYRPRATSAPPRTQRFAIAGAPGDAPARPGRLARRRRWPSSLRTGLVARVVAVRTAGFPAPSETLVGRASAPAGRLTGGRQS